MIISPPNFALISCVPSRDGDRQESGKREIFLPVDTRFGFFGLNCWYDQETAKITIEMVCEGDSCCSKWRYHPVDGVLGL